MAPITGWKLFKFRMGQKYDDMMYDERTGPIFFMFGLFVLVLAAFSPSIIAIVGSV
ncbi:hypothetical protein LCGC14_2660260 [marine sediment metagenome]|uniref:Uncharacterized protein n=1 Tax=marine sediment metagenome TaxID=412755 RepID=A0A0F8ZS48_9ZZZZ